MHHPKELLVDGKVFYLIPRGLFDQMEWALQTAANDGYVDAQSALEKADEYFPERG